MIILLKKGIFVKYNIIVNIVNIRRYNRYKICVVFLSFEIILLNIGLGILVFIIFKWLFLEFFMMVRVNIKIFILLIRWVKLC